FFLLRCLKDADRPANQFPFIAVAKQLDEGAIDVGDMLVLLNDDPVTRSIKDRSKKLVTFSDDLLGAAALRDVGDGPDVAGNRIGAVAHGNDLRLHPEDVASAVAN